MSIHSIVAYGVCFLVLTYMLYMPVFTSQGRRNGFVIGGAKKFFFELHFHIERIPFCTLVNM